jgi:hypothetical protein
MSKPGEPCPKKMEKGVFIEKGEINNAKHGRAVKEDGY